MQIQIEIDIQDAMDALDVMQAIMDSDQKGEVAGGFAVDRILSRTLAGRDVNDAPFAPYSDRYAARKGGNVNLVMTGEMLGSVDYSGSGDSAIISCSSSTAQYHEQGTSRMPQRQFMGLSAGDIQDLLQELIDDPLSKLIG